MPTLRQQIELIAGAFGYRFGPGELHDWTLDQLSAVLSSIGIADVRDIQIVDDVYRLGDCEIPIRYWRNARTGENLSVGGKTANVGGIKYLVNGSVLSIDGDTCEARGTCDNARGQGYVRCGEWPNTLYVKPNPSINENLLFETIGRYANDGRDTDVSVYVKFTDEGIPYFLISRRPHRSSKEGFKEFLSLAVVAASFAIPGLGPALTSSIFGSFAAAYPAVASALTNVALNTALNGGDVEAAVKKVAVNTLSAGAGNFVSGMTDSVAVAKLADVATNAAIRGESIESAVKNAALSLAPAVIEDVSSFTADVINSPEASDMSIFDIPAAPPTLDPSYSAPSIDEMASWSDTPYSPYVSSGFVGTVPDAAPVIEPIGLTLDELFAHATGDLVSPTDSNDALAQAIAQSPAPVDAPASSWFDEVTWEGTVDKLTDIAIAAIRVHSAYQAANRPPVQPAAQATRAGSTQVARPDGTLTTTDPTTGRVVVTRPPVGVPYALSDGGAVINNGNGTYTRVLSDGQTLTHSYASIVPPSGVARVQAATWIQGVPNWAVLAAGAGVFGLALMRK